MFRIKFRIKLKGKIIISVLTLIINLYCIFIFANTYHSFYYPEWPKADISHILEKLPLSADDYLLLYAQTGLGKQAVDDLIITPNGPDRILTFQTGYYGRYNTFTERINPFSSQESVWANGSGAGGLQLAPLRNGDILITKSAQTLFWRHGHCGIVIDAEKGITLESLEPGTISMTQKVSKWLSYPTFKILRLKNADGIKPDEIAKYAYEKLIGIKYKVFASKKYNNSIPGSENCSQLIWQAFYQFGYDIDSNRGYFVTPEDISKSDLLEIVQIHGFNPDDPW